MPLIWFLVLRNNQPIDGVLAIDVDHAMRCAMVRNVYRWQDTICVNSGMGALAKIYSKRRDEEIIFVSEWCQSLGMQSYELPLMTRL